MGGVCANRHEVHVCDEHVLGCHAAVMATSRTSKCKEGLERVGRHGARINAHERVFGEEVARRALEPVDANAQVLKSFVRDKLSLGFLHGGCLNCALLFRHTGQLLGDSNLLIHPRLPRCEPSHNLVELLESRVIHGCECHLVGHNLIELSDPLDVCSCPVNRFLVHFARRFDVHHNLVGYVLVHHIGRQPNSHLGPRGQVDSIVANLWDVIKATRRFLDAKELLDHTP